MTYTSITKSVRDADLVDRVRAAAVKEAWASPTFGATDFGQKVKDYPNYGAQFLIWPVAVDNEAAYEYALNNNVPNPGMDLGVISDASIQAGVQAHWPADPVPEA